MWAFFWKLKSCNFVAGRILGCVSSKLILLKIFLWCWGWLTLGPHHPRGGQRSASRSWLFPSTIWVLRVKLGSSGLVWGLCPLARLICPRSQGLCWHSAVCRLESQQLGGCRMHTAPSLFCNLRVTWQALPRCSLFLSERAEEGFSSWRRFKEEAKDP